MSAINITVDYTDVNNNSISKIKFRYSKDGVNWTEFPPKDITPSLSPLSVTFNPEDYFIGGGEYYLQLAIFDGSLWSLWSGSTSFSVQSYATNVVSSHDISDKSQTITFTVNNCSFRNQQIVLVPFGNNQNGFTAYLYNNSNMLIQTLTFNGGNNTPQNFNISSDSSETFKIKIIANVPNNIYLNTVYGYLKLSGDISGQPFVDFRVDRGNPTYETLTVNVLVYHPDTQTLTSSYPVTSDLIVTMESHSNLPDVQFGFDTGAVSDSCILPNPYDWSIKEISPYEDSTFSYEY